MTGTSTSLEPTITYGHWQAGLRGFPAMLTELIEDTRPKSVCDAGGGATAALSPEEIERLGVEDYYLLDIAQDELDKSPEIYTKVCADVCAPDLPQRVGRRFDLVQTHMLAEHIADPAVFHANVLAILNPGGYAIHIMPTMWDPAFVANRLLPERPAKWIVAKLNPDRRLDHDQAKFPAYYRWCRGPSQKQIARLQGTGFEVVAMHGYFGTGYGMRVKPLLKVTEAYAGALIRRPRPALTSYCAMVLRKPATAA